MAGDTKDEYGLATCMCLDTGKCPYYKNWAEQTKDERINIIYGISGKYLCRALVAVNGGDAERGVPGIPRGKNLQERINSERAKCPTIILLNTEGTQ